MKAQPLQRLTVLPAKASSRLASTLLHLSGYLLFLAYFFTFSSITIGLHESFRTHAYDLAYFDQVVWNTAQGHFFVSSLRPPGLLADHFSPILGLLAPLYRVWPDVRLLLVVQSLALAVSALPAYWLARSWSPALAPLVLLSLYLNPDLHAINLSQFREVALGVPLLALAAYALITHRRKLLLTSLALALLVKEEMAIVVFLFGLAMAWERRERLPGLLVSAAALLVGSIVLLIIIPHFKLAGGYSYWVRYSYLSAASDLSRYPQLFLENLLQPANLLTFFRVILPFVFLPLLGGRVFLVSLPVFAYLLASDFPMQAKLEGWYSGPLLPLLFVATALGLRRFHGMRRYLAVSLLLLASLLSFLAYTPHHLADLGEGMNAERARYVQRLIKMVPPQATLSAQSDLMPHLSQRPWIDVFPGVGDVEYVLLDTLGNTYPIIEEEEYRRAVQVLLSDPSYEILEEAKGFLLLKRREAGHDFGSPLALFGGSLALRGISLAVQDAEGVYRELSLPGSIPSGSRLRLSLYWQALDRVSLDYSVFVHVVAGGRRIGQHDGMPVANFRPTSQWRPGELVRDVHYLDLSPTPEPVQGQIVLGLYLWQTGTRLTTELNQDRYPALELRLTPR